jgi:DNA sulfur modification protein DndD
MILTRLSITNFGVYRDQHDFDLRPRVVDTETLPVVLFGGKNGAGKTTILEAIRLWTTSASGSQWYAECQQYTDWHSL